MLAIWSAPPHVHSIIGTYFGPPTTERCKCSRPKWRERCAQHEPCSKTYTRVSALGDRVQQHCRRCSHARPCKTGLPQNGPYVDGVGGSFTHERSSQVGGAGWRPSYGRLYRAVSAPLDCLERPQPRPVPRLQPPMEPLKS